MRRFLFLILILASFCNCKKKEEKISIPKFDKEDSTMIGDYLITSNGKVSYDSLLNENEKPKSKKELQQMDSIAELWNVMVFDKGGCLGGEQYVSKREPSKEKKQLIYSESHWKEFSKKDKIKLTEFLISKLSDTTKTKVHTCPFFGATNGEVAVYSLQHIYQKNWFDFSEFEEYKKRETKSASEQPQIWIQKILENETERKKLAELFYSEMKK